METIATLFNNKGYARHYQNHKTSFCILFMLSLALSFDNIEFGSAIHSLKSKLLAWHYTLLSLSLQI